MVANKEGFGKGSKTNNDSSSMFDSDTSDKEVVDFVNAEGEGDVAVALQKVIAHFGGIPASRRPLPIYIYALVQG